MARLAYEIMPRPIRIWGIMAPIAFYMLHWGNYYVISTDVVPQNIGIFLLIAAFLLLNRPMSGLAGTGFIILFGWIHMATCTMFVLAVGTAKIADEGVCLVRALISKRKYATEWHIFEKISFIPAFLVIIMYGLYAGKLLPYRPLSSIGYADEYAKKFPLLEQPYMDSPQQALIWLAIVGLALLPLWVYCDPKRKRLLLVIGFGFVLPWTFLQTPLVAYHAFFASWQSFRYFLVMYPSIIILATIPFAAAGYGISRIASKNLTAGITSVLLILMLPVTLKISAHQQELVALDMITGRDGGAYAATQIEKINELTVINDAFPSNGVLIFGKRFFTPYSQWAFSPRPLFTVASRCTEAACPAYDMFAQEKKRIWDIPSPGLGLFDKNDPYAAEARKVFEKIFSLWKETDEYVIYHTPRTQ